MATELELLPQQLPADRRPDLVYLAHLSPSGRRTQAHALQLVADIVFSASMRPHALDNFPWHMLRYQHTQTIRARLISDVLVQTGSNKGKPISPAFANKVLAALRGVLREAWRLGLMSAEDYQRACDLEPVKGSVLPAGRELSSGEIGGLIDACQDDRSPAGARDAAIIGLLYACGLRRGEVVSMDLSDFEASGKLIIRGKGSKERTAYVTNGALDALSDWLSVRGNFDGPLFVPINRGGHISTGRMTTQAVYNMLVKRGAEAGVEGFSPHDFRRSFISDLLDKGADIATVSKMAGHANVQTTARYDRRPEEAKQKAAKLLHVPYRRRKDV